MMTRAVRFVVTAIVFFGLLFLTAGTVRWPAAWAYAVLVSATLLTYSAILLRLHPDLIDERTRPPADAKKWDKPFVFVLGGIGTFGQLLVCGFDHRYSWSPPMPGWLIVVGLLLLAAGGTLTNWAVASNRFFSAFVRIQRDRGTALSTPARTASFVTRGTSVRFSTCSAQGWRSAPGGP